MEPILLTARERALGRRGPLRIALVCDGDPTDRTVWSGTPHSMMRALAAKHELLVIRNRWPRWYRFWGRLLKYGSLERIDYVWSRWYGRLASRRTRRDIIRFQPDAIVSVALTDMATYFTSIAPHFFVTDASWTDLVNYYDMHRKVPIQSQRRAFHFEKSAMIDSLATYVPSDWARASIIRNHGAGPDKVVMIPWGPNARIPEAVERSIGGSKVRIIFVGRDWNRKGGNLAVDIVKEIHRRGVNVRMDIVGATNIDADLPDYCVNHGRLNLDNDSEQARLMELFSNAHFFLMPTAAEAYGIVFAEAAAQGLPAISHATGGVTTVVRDGETGVLLPLGSAASEFADRIAQLIDDPAAYRHMSRSAIQWAKSCLTWEHWADAVTADIESRLAHRPELSASGTTTCGAGATIHR